MAIQKKKKTQEPSLYKAKHPWQVVGGGKAE